MKINQCMKRNVISFKEMSTIREAPAVFAKEHVRLLPVVDQPNKLVRVIGSRNLRTLELPDFIRFGAEVE